MGITTIAAVVGFKCLSLGKLPMISTGVVFCMIVALPLVPSVLVLLEMKR